MDILFLFKEWDNFFERTDITTLPNLITIRYQPFHILLKLIHFFFGDP